MLKKTGDFFYKMCLCLVLFFSLLIFLGSLIVLKDVGPGQQNVLGHIMHRLPVPAAFLLLASLLLLFYQKCGSLLQRRELAVWLFCIMVALQVIFFVFVSHPMYTTDTLKVHSQSLNMLMKQGGWLSFEQKYWQKYSNNYLFTVVFYYFYSFLSSIGITNFWLPAVVLNAFCIDLAIFLSYLSAHKLLGRKTANMFLILSICCPTTYVWLGFVYTNTLSLPFVMGILYLFLRLQEFTLGRKQRIAISIGLGVCIVIGYKIRPTTILPVIALALFEGIKLVSKERGKIRYTIKKLLFQYGIVALAGIISSFTVTALMDRHVQKGYEDLNYPATHWLMMGLNIDSEGAYDFNDSSYTSSFPTKAQRIEANLLEMKKRISTLGVKGLARLAVMKLKRVWMAGDDDSFGKARYAFHYPALYEPIMGSGSALFRVYTQGFRAVTFFFICISILLALLRKNKKDIFIYMLTLLGSISFFLLWEANRKYNLCFMYVCLLLAADGMQMLEAGEKLARKRFKSVRFFNWYVDRARAKTLFCLSLCCAAILCLTVPKLNLLYGSNIQQVYAADAETDKKIIKKGSCYRQILQQGQDYEKNQWNELELYFKQTKRWKAKDKYHMTIYSMPSGQALHEADIRKTDLENGWWRFAGSMEPEKGNSYYVLELQHIGKHYSMIPYVKDSSVIDMYPYGGLDVDGEPAEYDLCFRIHWNTDISE